MIRLFRILLYAYPPSLRRAHGDDMTAVFRDAWLDARARSFLVRVRVVLRVLGDFLRCWPAAWRHTRSRKASLVTAPILLHMKFALRLLRRHPASSIATVLTLTLAIGLNTAVFSVVHAVLLEPLPYPDADRVVRVWEHNVPRQNDRNVVAPANYLEWRDRAVSFSTMAAFGERRATLTGDGIPEDLPAIGSTWNLFEVLKVQPAFGRAFTAADGDGNAAPVAYLSWQIWERRYGSDPAIAGRMITVNGRSTQVVGILPKDFSFFGDRPDVWLPFSLPESARVPRGRSLQVVARLSPGVSLAAAQAEMDGINLSLRDTWKDFNAGWAVRVVGALDDMVGPSRPVLLLLLAAVGVVLLVGCANTANLLLARAADRRRELAVRSAVGASRADLIRQLFVEGLVLASVGAIGGVLLAITALRLCATRVADMLDVPRLGDASLHPTVLLFTLGLMGICALVFSVLPALHLRDASGSGLVSEGRSATSTRRDQRVRQTLVVTQLSLALVLVVAGGLVGKSLGRLTAVDPGFRPEGVLTFMVSLPAVRYTGPDTVRFFDGLASRLETIPGVTRAAGNAWLPFTGFGGATSFVVAGQPAPSAAERPVADIRPVTHGYFEVMGIPVRQGRTFTALEDREARRVVVVNETLARQYFGNGPVLGQRLVVNWGPPRPAGSPVVDDEIVGVVADSKLQSLTEPTRPMIYYALAASPVSAMTMVVKADVEPLSLTRSVEAEVRALDTDLPITRVRSMNQLMGLAVATPAVTSWLVISFAGLTLVLALIGIAGLQAASVAARLPEFGLRLALGATPGGLRRHVLRQGAWLIAIGLVAGGAVSLLITRLAARELYDVTPTDPAVLLSAAALVAASALLAADIPARRATRVDPAGVLRN
jgi:putative ABC transport system permease protein